MEKYDDLLIESKRTISKWEHEFQKTHGTRPSKVKIGHAFFPLFHVSVHIHLMC